jgi:hypothetical protein
MARETTAEAATSPHPDVHWRLFSAAPVVTAHAVQEIKYWMEN